MPSVLPVVLVEIMPSYPWFKASLGGLLKDEDGTGRVREAADHLVDRPSYCSCKWQGRDEFPPFLGMFIEQMLYVLERGTIVRGQLHDFV